MTGQTLAAGLQPATLVGLLGAGGAGGQAGGAPHPEEEEEVTICSRFKIQDSRFRIQDSRFRIVITKRTTIMEAVAANAVLVPQVPSTEQ